MLGFLYALVISLHRLDATQSNHECAKAALFAEIVYVLSRS